MSEDTSTLAGTDNQQSPIHSSSTTINGDLVDSSQFGLRRSGRRVQHKKTLAQEAEEDAVKEKAKSLARKEKLKATKLQKKAQEKEKEKEVKRLKAEKAKSIKLKQKQKQKEKLKQKQKNQKVHKKEAEAKAKLKIKIKTKKLIEKQKETVKKNVVPEANLSSTNWMPNTPLLTSDFKTHTSVPSRLRNPNMRAVPYANDVVKVMSFINKFCQVFDETLWNLSFQDFEIGLDLYPDEAYATMDKVTAKQQAQYGRKTLYQDILSVKKIIAAQDKMNLLFLSFLHLLSNATNNPSYTYTSQSKALKPQVTADKLQSSKKVYAKYVENILKYAYDWGYPKEWRKTVPKDIDVLQPNAQYFLDNDVEPVDTKNKEILTPNIFTWYKYESLPVELDPLHNPELSKLGLLALEPKDRIIMLRTLVNWCIGYSPSIHVEIHRLTNFKKDPAFGVQTAHVARYMMDGAEETEKSFQQLCGLVQSKYEERIKSGYLRKLIATGKRTDLEDKLAILKQLKATYKSMSKEEKDKAMIADHKKWCYLSENDVNGNPLGNPFEDDLYKLRSHEFFLARIPYIGDFYLPRLFTYHNEKISNITTYADYFSLKNLLDKFSSGAIDTYTLFENYGKMMSSNFKILYHDTPSMIRDFSQNKNSLGKNYWYEMCHDSKSLQEFLEFLDYKLVVKPSSQKKKKLSSNNEAESNETDELSINEGSERENSVLDGEQQGEVDESKDRTINKSPLPSEPRFNITRKKLSTMKNFLSKLYYMLVAFEKLEDQFNDLEVGKRSLRRGQRRNYNVNQFDDMDVDEDEDYNQE